MTIKKLGSILLALLLMLGAISPAALAANSDSKSNGKTVYISNAEELQQFAINCKLDSYSVNLTAYLTDDIDMTGIPFDPIGSFSGHFLGKGHSIKGLTLSSDGSYQGLFRYIQADGVVSDLTVYGTISPENLQNNVGGIAGYNYGQIYQTSFNGTVNGLENVGGIVGTNLGIIDECTTTGYVSGKTGTGGIAGTNSGTIRNCTNYSSVNISVRETETTVEDLNILDLSNLGLITSSSSDTVSDTGGIAGYNDGTLSACTNSGDIGYTTYGYNVGGICGRQACYVTGCTNYGKVLGRQDVGGVIGQMEPYLLKTQVESLLDELQALTDSMNAAMGDLGANAGSTRGVMQQISASAVSASEDAYEMDQNSEDPVLPSEDSSTEDSSEEDSGVNWDEVQQKAEDAGDYAGGVADDLGEDTMQDIVNGNVTDEDIGVIEDVGGGVASDGADAASSKIDDLKAQKAQEQAEQDAKDAAYEQAYNDLGYNVSSMSGQIVQLNNMLADSLGDLASDMGAVNSHFNRVSKLVANLMNGDFDKISDISKYDSESLINGKVIGCTNYGEVDGESNIGGIGGNMSVEVSNDMEGVISSQVSSMEIVRNTYEERCVTRDCVNYGTITGKKSNIGGIVGTEEIGAIFGCEDYGSVEAEDANYVGGIAGHSDSYINSCYTMCDLMGSSYVGGIAGYGLEITDCSTLINMLNTPASCGAIAGYADETLYGLEDEDNVDSLYLYVYGNTFVHDTLGGIDNLSYAEQAYPVDYETLLSRDDIPNAFRTLYLTFVADGETVAVVPFSYGEDFDTSKIPEVPEKEGASGYWPDYDYTNLTFSDTLVADYVSNSTTLASPMTREGTQQSVVLSEGTFSNDASMTAVPYTGSAPSFYSDVSIQEILDVNILNNKTGSESYTIRYLKPEVASGDVLKIYVRDQDTGSWHKTAWKERGSYITFPASGDEVVFCAVTTHNNTVLTICFSIAAILVILILLLALNSKLKQNKRQLKHASGRHFTSEDDI